jgi:hypothetical protein
MSDADSRRFIIRDRNWHPKALTPDYKTSIARSPRQALVSIPQSVSETSGPDFSHLKFGKFDNDLLLNFNNCAINTASRFLIPWWKSGRLTQAAAIVTRTTATWRRWTQTSAAWAEP